jgi:hypothetical protein
MSSPILSTSPGAREVSANPSSAGKDDEKPRLSEHEKKANHIASGKSSPQFLPPFPHLFLSFHSHSSFSPHLSAILYLPSPLLTSESLSPPIFPQPITNTLSPSHRAKTPPRNPRRFRPPNRARPRSRRPRPLREYRTQEDSRLHACADRGASGISR